LRTAPVFLPVKAVWHNLARLTINKNHGDGGMGDRALAIWVGAGYYHFTAYTPGNANIV
jgi:hypothetical protein